jgi:cell division protein FtsW
MTTVQKNHIDIWLLIAVLGLMVISLGVVYSASAEWAYARYENQNHYIDLHAIKILLSIAALFLGLSVPHRIYKKLAKPALMIAIAFLAVTLVLGGETKGAVRWLRFGGLGFQPSEFAKFTLLFHLCALLATKGEMIKDLKKGFIPAMIWIGVVTALVMLQPNFSTSAMIVVLSLMMLFVGGVRISHLAAAVGCMIPILAGYVLMAPYRMQRVKLFLQSRSNGRANYQLWQGIIGFGNGGIFGVGPGESRQRDLFLPESYNDFVYSIIGEEYGFIGAMLILAVFLFIMIRGWKIAKHAKDDFGRYLAIAITGTITLYAVVNACVALGIFPTTGLPMPFISYGGSALLMTAFAAGVLLNISAYTDLHPRIRKAEAAPEPQLELGKAY